MLIFPRFVSLSLNFVLAVMVYFTFHCMLQGEIRWSDFLAGLHEYKALGNPTWFILMTLLTYILTFSCFSLTGGGRPTLFVMCLTALLIAAIFLVSRIKPSHWVNTILCFPAGMFYYLYGEKLENLLRKTHLPAIVLAGLLLVSGKAIYDANIWPAIYSQNVGGVLFALGITWFVGSFAWKKPSHALVWLGGSGLFVVYMFHLLPMRVMTHLGLNTNNPYLVWLAVAISTAVLVLMASYGYKKLNTLLFSK